MVIVGILLGLKFSKRSVKKIEAFRGLNGGPPAKMEVFWVEHYLIPDRSYSSCSVGCCQN